MHVSLVYRCLILTGLFATATWLLAAMDAREPASVARWPRAESVYAVQDWTVGEATVADSHGVSFVTRNYYNPNGVLASLTLATSPEAKRIYRATADVSFLGSGYTVDRAPPSLVSPTVPWDALIVRREDDVRLLLYTYGERRGHLGNGVLGWSMAVVDGLLGHPNDYYVASILVALDRPDATAALGAVGLADAIFPRLAACYAAAASPPVELATSMSCDALNGSIEAECSCSGPNRSTSRQWEPTQLDVARGGLATGQPTAGGRGDG